MAMLAATATTAEWTALGVIDCDIHNALPPGALYRYLPERWRSYHERFGRRNFTGAYYPKATPNAARTDAFPPSGGRPGSDLAFLQAQLLDAWEIAFGILNP